MPERVPQVVRSAPRMTDAEAVMWLVEREPALRSAFTSVTFLDRRPDMDAFRQRMARAVALIPRLRQRVVDPPVGWLTPAWADDDQFDLDFHVRHVCVPPPATRREVLDLAGLLHQEVFDPARPLWQYTVVEGLEGGEAALIAKMHHTISDGVGAIRLSAMFTDIEPDPDRSREPLAVVSEAAQAPSAGDVALALARRPVALGGQLVRGAITAVTHPVEAATTAADVARQAVVTGPARSPLWAGRHSAARHFEILSADLDEAKAAAKRLGGTVNDFYVAAVAGAAGAYHRAKGVEADQLRAAIPVSTRADRSAGGNAFVPARTLVPAGELDAARRFAVVHDRLATMKANRAISAGDALASLVTVLPAALVRRVALAQVGTIDFAASNVRGAPFDLFIAGAAILSNHPMGPTGGTAFNATLLSYRGSMDIGLNIDPAAVDDPELLRCCLANAIEELIGA